ncbi:hypothetical protein Poly24_07760 [Rosistilla carotiformis]|uniref:Uncharacterized protein n=1 Tax=Rosistilla carotiformis TaxID=2528017 RepID=A0A518JNF6_9BACT|nr:hypothetical protein Poly24_07760 [Rosistilla carotiformis]
MRKKSSISSSFEGVWPLPCEQTQKLVGENGLYEVLVPKLHLEEFFPPPPAQIERLGFPPTYPA